MSGSRPGQQPHGEHVHLHPPSRRIQHQAPRPLLSPAIQPRLFEYISGALRQAGASPTAVGGFDDHVHLLFSASGNFVLPEFVKELKRATNGWLKKESLVPTSFGWQRGYGAFSIARWDVSKVAHYIRGQAEHHRRMSFEVEYRKLLDRHGIVFDEKYLLD